MSIYDDVDDGQEPSRQEVAGRLIAQVFIDTTALDRAQGMLLFEAWYSEQERQIAREERR